MATEPLSFDSLDALLESLSADLLSSPPQSQNPQLKTNGSSEQKQSNSSEPPRTGTLNSQTKHEVTSDSNLTTSPQPTSPVPAMSPRSQMEVVSPKATSPRGPLASGTVAPLNARPSKTTPSSTRTAPIIVSSLSEIRELRLKEIQEKLAKLSQELQLAILRNEYETVKAIDAQIANLEEEKRRMDCEKNISSIPTDPTGTIRTLRTGQKQQERIANSTLEKAAAGGRLATVIELLDSGMDINAVDFVTGNSALHAAAEIGHIELVKVLVDRGIDINMRNRRGLTALHISVERRMDEVTDYLLNRGAKTDIDDNIGRKALDMAASTPIYHGELKEKIRQATKLQSQSNAVVETIPNDEFVEVVDIYLRNGRRFGFPAKIGDTASHVIYSVAMKLNVKHVVPDLELIEDNLGKERALKPDEKILDVKALWRNDNPKYSKFVVKLKRGAPETSQMDFRTAMYDC